tara:strand:- start:8019 stop:8546 length:528 start_codon:yes stop_codon:yes gene_type:complete
MVVNGCLLEDAYGVVDIKKPKKKKHRRKDEFIEIDRQFMNSSDTIQGNTTNDSYYTYKPPKNEGSGGVIKQQTSEELHHPLEELQKSPEELQQPPPVENPPPPSNDSDRVHQLNKDYQDFIQFQKNRYEKIHTGNITEGFSNINDNFNDVLLFGLLGIFFLIFTDYIYKLGKRSY